jgi:hypothetical protein
MSETEVTIGLAVAISTLIGFLFKLFQRVTGPDNANASKLLLLEEKLCSEKRINELKTADLTNHYKTILESIVNQQKEITCLTNEVVRLASSVDTLIDGKKRN